MCNVKEYLLIFAQIGVNIVRTKKEKTHERGKLTRSPLYATGTLLHDPKRMTVKIELEVEHKDIRNKDIHKDIRNTVKHLT